MVMVGARVKPDPLVGVVLAVGVAVDVAVGEGLGERDPLSLGLASPPPGPESPSVPVPPSPPEFSVDVGDSLADSVGSGVSLGHPARPKDTATAMAEKPNTRECLLTFCTFTMPTSRETVSQWPTQTTRKTHANFNLAA